MWGLEAVPWAAMCAARLRAVSAPLRRHVLSRGARAVRLSRRLAASGGVKRAGLSSDAHNSWQEATAAAVAPLAMHVAPLGDVLTAGPAAGGAPVTLGRRAVLVTSDRGAGTEPLAKAQYFLQRRGVQCLTVTAGSGPPRPTRLDEAVTVARRTGCDCVVAVGGGSVLDFGKALAVLLANPVPMGDYFTHKNPASLFPLPAVPLLMLPTAPSGAELRRRPYVLFKDEAIMRMDMGANAADAPFTTVLDHSLYNDIPPYRSAVTTMAALLHGLETLVSCDASHNTRLLSRGAILAAADALRSAAKDSWGSANAREAAMAAGAMSSAALECARAGAIRGIGNAVIGSYTMLYSDAVCAVAPLTLAATIDELEVMAEGGESSDSEDETSEDEDVVAVQAEGALSMLGATASDLGAPAADAAELVPALEALMAPHVEEHGGWPSLDEADFQEADIVRVANAAEVDEHVSANAAPLSRDEIMDILRDS